MVKRDSTQIEIFRPRRELQNEVATFFELFSKSPDAAHFHPHPFTAEEARKRCEYSGLDVYCIALADSKVIAYGMLRGWDAGYEVPSLGIAVATGARGMGIGKLIMTYLHSEARRRGSSRIRLKVYPGNLTAVSLYRSLGYEFEHKTEDGQLVGYYDCRLSGDHRA